MFQMIKGWWFAVRHPMLADLIVMLAGDGDHRTDYVNAMAVGEVEAMARRLG